MWQNAAHRPFSSLEMASYLATFPGRRKYCFNNVQNYSSNKTLFDKQNHDNICKKLTFCCGVSSKYYKYLVYITLEFQLFGSCCYLCTYMHIILTDISPWNRLLSAGNWDHVLYRGWNHWSFYQPPSWINERPDANALSTSGSHAEQLRGKTRIHPTGKPTNISAMANI